MSEFFRVFLGLVFLSLAGYIIYSLGFFGSLILFPLPSIPIVLAAGCFDGCFF